MEGLISFYIQMDTPACQLVSRHIREAPVMKPLWNKLRQAPNNASFEVTFKSRQDVGMSLVVKNLPSNTGGGGSTPDWGTKIPHTVEKLSPCAPQLRPRVTQLSPCAQLRLCDPAKPVCTAKTV